MSRLVALAAGFALISGVAQANIPDAAEEIDLTLVALSQPLQPASLLTPLAVEADAETCRAAIVALLDAPLSAFETALPSQAMACVKPAE